MRPDRLVRALLTAALIIASPGTDVAAQIVRIEMAVVESPAFDGAAFGTAGQFERLRGSFHGEVDPSHPLHAEIVNLDFAPRNTRGRVEYSTTVEIVRPIDSSGWNGAIYHTVPNRGGAVAGDPTLLELGFALVQVGWQGDLAPTERNIVPTLPVARNPDGSPIVGRAMEEFIFNNSDTASTVQLSYPVASLDPSRATLTVRGRQLDSRSTPPDLNWRFMDESHIRIERPAGFDGGAIYEFIYDAKDPIVMGLGFAAMRDAISFLRYEVSDANGTPNPLGTPALPTAALSIGISQSGRFLRDMLYLGFNEDVEGRIVFDGIHPDIAGSRKTFTNYAFSQPGRWQKQHEDHLYPGDQFPFTYQTLFDPVSGRTDGLLLRCSLTGTCPKIVHTDGEAELWQGRSSLVVTAPDGSHLELPENVRAYLIAGTQHGGGSGVHVATPRAGICVNPSNPMALSQIRRAVTVALYEWVVHEKEPPASRFPTRVGGGLVPPDSLRFPAIPGVAYTGSHNPLRVNDHGRMPPVQGAEYTVLVGRVNADGNMIDGVLHPNLSVPIGTFTGWNLRSDEFGAGEQCAGTGSFIPFAETRAARLLSGDPRPSLEERYGSPADYVIAVRRATETLVEERLLLARDAIEIVEQAEASGITARH